MTSQTERREPTKYLAVEYSFLDGLRELETSIDPFHARNRNKHRIPTNRLQTLLGESLRWKQDFHQECLHLQDHGQQTRLIQKTAARVMGINKSSSLGKIVKITYDWRSKGSELQENALALESLVELAYSCKTYTDNRNQVSQLTNVDAVVALLISLKGDATQRLNLENLTVASQMIRRLIARRSLNSNERLQFSSENRGILDKLSEKYGGSQDNMEFKRCMPSRYPSS